MDLSFDSLEGPSFLFVDEDFSFEKEINNTWIEWLTFLFDAEQKPFNIICFHYCSDEFLHKLNMDYLQHDTLTDIISFQYQQSPIEGDIYISLDRAKENAKLYGSSEQEEILRLHAHGCLHFCGYKDKTVAQKKIMRERENFYIGEYLRQFG
jgi:probable rRNA maturation factor